MQQPPCVRAVTIPFSDLRVTFLSGADKLTVLLVSRVFLYKISWRSLSSYSDGAYVQERGKDDLGVMIEESLGPHGLGIVSIADVSRAFAR